MKQSLRRFFQHSTTSTTTSTRICQVLVPFATGSEDIELSAITDTLRRAEIKVILASIESNQIPITLSRGLKIYPDDTLQNLINCKFDAIVLPGGMPGAQLLSSDSTLLQILKAHQKDYKLIGAICASPAIILAQHGLLVGKKNVTCYPTFAEMMPVSISTESVAVDKNLITSQGPATAIVFALQIVAALKGYNVSEQIGKAMLVDPIELEKINKRNITREI